MIAHVRRVVARRACAVDQRWPTQRWIIVPSPDGCDFERKRIEEQLSGRDRLARCHSGVTGRPPVGSAKRNKV